MILTPRPLSVVSYKPMNKLPHLIHNLGTSACLMDTYIHSQISPKLNLTSLLVTNHEYLVKARTTLDSGSQLPRCELHLISCTFHNIYCI